MSDLASLLTDKHLGYALELVLSNVIQNNVRKVNKRSVASYVSAHDELSKAVAAADTDTLGAFAAFVNDAVDVTAIALKTKAKRDTKKKGVSYHTLFGNKVSAIVAGGTGAFDIETEKANIHVKLNQSAENTRVIGFQKNVIRQGEITRAGTHFGNAYFAKLDTVMLGLKEQVIQNIMSRLKGNPAKVRALAEKAYAKYSNPNTGMPRKPPELHGSPGPKHSFTITKQAIKDTFATEGFKRLFRGRGFAALIAKDLRERVFNPSTIDEGGKTIGFAKYTCGRDADGMPINLNLSLDIYMLDILDDDIPINAKFFSGGGKKQPYGVICLADEDPKVSTNVLFYIELRTDGEGHPPQLKIGNVNKLHSMLMYKPV